MQNTETKKVFDVWKNELSNKIKKYNPYKVSEQLQQFAGLFSLGPFYFYVLNFHDLTVDYAHHTTQDLLGIPPEDFSMETLLSKLPEEELKELHLKEALAADFLNNKISKNDLLNYKAVYFFKVFNADGELRTFLHQATTIKQSTEGNIEHVLGIQMDVTDFKVVKNSLVSFIGLDDCPSYYNINPEVLPYDYSQNKPKQSPLKNILSNRELEIVSLLSKGYVSKEIADRLCLSLSTVSTHRKNILKKTGAKSTAEIISWCLVDGVI